MRPKNRGRTKAGKEEMMTAPMITTLGAKLSRRLLTNRANNHYAQQKRQAHKRDRKNNRIFELDNCEYGYTHPTPTRRLTNWDIT